jgi:hypothetical protein
MTALRALVFVALVLIPAWAHAGNPAVVTTVRGDVTLSSGDPLAPPPALIPPGQTLTVGAGATVILLWQGSALKFDGPCQIDPATLQAPEEARSEHASALQGLLTRQSSTSRPAASRGAATVALKRPVAGLPLLELGGVRWTCDGCGELEVVVEDAREETVVWSSRGEGQLDYDGPALKPGSYYLRLGGVDHLFRVAPADQVEELQGALTAAAAVADTLVDADPAARVGITTAALLHEGLYTDALYRLDQALAAHPDDELLLQLLVDYETRAGLRR